MSLKKLSAGSGYEYLTRQVAALDSTELGRTKLGDYYSAKGEVPGRWLGSGLRGIDGLDDGDTVTAEQMKNLFGEGRHPLTGNPLGRAYRPDAVAGFDLTFSPVKSVSTLWAIATPDVAHTIEQAHYDAIRDALHFLGTHAIFTREGTDGVRQVETRGLIGAAFTHRDSRAGDPDLHTHVAIANKVQTREGKWLSIYGTVLHEHVVAASEAYNTALEYRLREVLGVRFSEAPTVDGKRPVREIAGVNPKLMKLWSGRRTGIDERVAELAAEFTETHGRAPTAKQRIALAQRANLETREAKHEPRSEVEQRRIWLTQAMDLLGYDGVRRTLNATLTPKPSQPTFITAAWLETTANDVIAELESHRATWQTWHIYAEAQRQVRDVYVPAADLDHLVDHLVDKIHQHLINLTPDHDPIPEPAGLRRSDGASVYRHTGADHFTSQRMLDAEQRIVDAAGRRTVPVPDVEDVDLELMEIGLRGTRLNDGQHQLVRRFATDPRQVTLALAPAGSGKTTAMNALNEVLTNLGYEVYGFAPSAAAAQVLHDATGMPTETLAMLDMKLRVGDLANSHIDPTVFVIDEAGMADTPTLDRLIAAAGRARIKVCLIGDDQQLAAVGAGGVLRDIATTHGAVRLADVVRFADPVEAKATLALRDGDPGALGFYLDHDRIHDGDAEGCLADVLDAWQSEQANGRDCLMLAPTRDLVARLNHQARIARGAEPGPEVQLRDGNRASAGDVVLSRRNDRRLGVSGTDWVKNGDRWTVTEVRTNGSLCVRHLTSGLQTRLPAAYVAAHVELGYATTVHAAQGSTADVVHGIVTGSEDRQLLYTMLTRGRAENHLHVVTDQVADEPFLPELDPHTTAVDLVTRIIERDGSATSATAELTRSASLEARLHDATERYVDAVVSAARRVYGSGADDAIAAAGRGPLPWLPGIPMELRSGSEVSGYLTQRANRVEHLASLVGHEPRIPPKLAEYERILPPELLRRVVIWRAAEGVTDPNSLLAGPQDRNGKDPYARQLRREVAAQFPEEVRRWETTIGEAIGQRDLRNQQTLALARLLTELRARGFNSHGVLAAALRRGGPLPSSRPVEALTYRIQQLALQRRGPDPTHPSRSSSPTHDLAPRL